MSGTWKWESDRRELPPAEDPVFIFSAHCAWCQWKKSENRLKVKLVRPEITKAEWKDGEGKQTDTNVYGVQQQDGRESWEDKRPCEGREGGSTMDVPL